VDSGFRMEPSLNLVELLSVASPRRVRSLHIASDRVFEDREDQPRLAFEHRPAPGQIQKLGGHQKIRFDTCAQPRIGSRAFVDYPVLIRRSVLNNLF
jgi:hypothetical protein